MIDFDKVLEHVGGFGKYQITSKSYRWLVWEPKFESGMSGKASGLDEDLTKIYCPMRNAGQMTFGKMHPRL